MSIQSEKSQFGLTLKQILARGSVPTLPAVAMQLLEMTGNPEVKLNEIASLIQSDPGLASKVLKTVNSSFYGLPKPCPSIERAITLLGFKAIKSLVLGFSMVSLTHEMDEQIDLHGFWKHTIISAVAARQIALVAGVDEPDEVFTSALLQDIGVLAMLASYPETYGPLIAKSDNCHYALLRLERERLGLDHLEIGSALAQKWKLPEPIISGIRHHHNKLPPANECETLIRCVVAGELAATAMISEVVGQPLATLFATINAWFGQGEEVVEELIDKIQQSSREIAKLLDQQIGAVPSAQELLSRANEQLSEEQIQSQRDVEQARHDAITDGLTGIPNRKHFDRLIDAAVAGAITDQACVAVLFTDADKFKFVNDTYGHPCGDAVLVELAKRITDTVGDRGTACRYGGEEFVVVLPGVDIEQARAVGEEIRKAIDSRPFELTDVPGGPDEPLSRSVSVGVAAWTAGKPEVSAEQLVQRADKAVYTAKEAGRNNVKCWGVDTGRRVADRHADQAARIGVSLDALPPDDQTHVLLVEDDPLAARLIRAMLVQNKGVSVEIKPDGRLAVEYMRDCLGPGGRMPDLIISDMNIPGYNGLQIIRALKANARFSSIPIVVISASWDEELHQACVEAGAEQVYDKLDISGDLKTWCTDLVRTVKRAA